MLTRRPIQTRFPFAYAAEPLKLANTNNSQTHFAKGTLSHGDGSLRHIVLQLFVDDAVSGSISLPFRGSFHLSLTVLDALSVTTCT